MYDITNGNNGYIPFGAPVTITVLAIATRPAMVQYGAADSAYSFCSPGNSQAPLLGHWLPGLNHPATSTSATIKWTQSSGAVGYAIGLYQPGPLFNSTTGYVKRPPTTSITFTNLIPNTPYNVFI